MCLGVPENQMDKVMDHGGPLPLRVKVYTG